MTSIPADIWTHVAKFIPEYALGSMLSINSAFFQLVMNARYHDVVFSTFDKASLEHIRRLRDPIIALRVRKLHVDMHRGKWALNDNELACGISVGEVMQTITETVNCFVDLDEFSFDWLYQDPRVEESWLSFLTAAWKTFGSHLQKLTVIVLPRMLPALLSTTTSLTSPMGVRNIRVCLDVHFQEKLLNEAESAASAQALAQFIDKMGPTRHALSFSSSWYDIELPRFSRHLGNIPRLEHNTSVGDDSASGCHSSFDLTGVIRNHIANLWPLHTSGPHLGDAFVVAIASPDALQEQRGLGWLKKHGLDVIFSNLLKLRLVVPWDPSAFSLIVQCIRCSQHSLISLGFSGRGLSYDEVNVVASIFSAREAPPLQMLDLQAHFLSPELILLLAQMLPCLEKLSIRFQQIKAHNGEGDGENQDDIALMPKFAEAMKACDISHWSLHDIALVKDRSFDRDMETMLMWAFAGCVPSVRKFRGEDKRLFMHMTL